VVVADGLAVCWGDRWVFESVSVAVCGGEVLAIIGPSGSGKTTLLRCLAGIVEPQRGRVVVAGVDLGGLSAEARASHRLQHIGFVLQDGDLLPELSVVENVALPARLAGAPRSAAEEVAFDLLASLGLAAATSRAPDQLSGGERRRVALARALVNGPDVVLADEPTGSLDETTTLETIEVLLSAVKARGAACVIVTHDPVVARAADRVLRLTPSGVVASD
jgi:ABC-type lipoprotein export system ATPase subunit